MVDRISNPHLTLILKSPNQHVTKHSWNAGTESGSNMQQLWVDNDGNYGGYKFAISSLVGVPFLRKHSHKPCPELRHHSSTWAMALVMDPRLRRLWPRKVQHIWSGRDHHDHWKERAMTNAHMWCFFGQEVFETYEISEVKLQHVPNATECKTTIIQPPCKNPTKSDCGTGWPEFEVFKFQKTTQGYLLATNNAGNVPHRFEYV